MTTLALKANPTMADGWKDYGYLLFQNKRKDSIELINMDVFMGTGEQFSDYLGNAEL